PDAALPRVPGYQVLGELGRGGMGVVYKARQAGLNRLVALKMIRNSVGATPGELDRFRAEAQAVARLQHPNIVQIFEIGEWSAGGGTARRNPPIAHATGAPILSTSPTSASPRNSTPIRRGHAKGPSSERPAT